MTRQRLAPAFDQNNRGRPGIPRLRRFERKVKIVEVLREVGHPLTIKQLAAYEQLERSPYLMGLLRELVEEGEIVTFASTQKRGPLVLMLGLPEQVNNA